MLRRACWLPPQEAFDTPLGPLRSLAVRGRARWTLHLLTDRLVQLQVVDAISHEPVRQTLKKTTCSLTSKSAG